MQDRAPLRRLALRLAPVLRRTRRGVEGLYAAAGLYLSVGLALSLAALWGLAGLAEDVMEGETQRFDDAVLRWMNARATPWLDVAALSVTVLGDTLVAVTLAAVAASILYLLERRDLAALLAAAVAGACVINPVLKMLFDRPRPQLFEWRAHYAGLSSFPSGHATTATVLFVALVYVIHRLARRRWMEVAACALAALLILLIGSSRLYLGVHYPSDVLAGYAVGFAWATFCAVGVEALGRIRARLPLRDGEGAGPGRIRTAERGTR